ncbi:hypothetical protein AVEN_6211-1 [Araneus ventricosus]|uniref:Uncharacterized protein n=1 Tax=Araneus ventricosus TaxID=182803 RepID=A0A4Y2NFU8_ARAVE|nr:hypothetical protein AVEN_6211-1 [Araneus ventricosus]
MATPGNSRSNFCNTPAAESLDPVRFDAHRAHKHGGSPMELGFESAALRMRNRDLTTKQPRRSLIMWHILEEKGATGSSSQVLIALPIVGQNSLGPVVAPSKEFSR